MSKKRNKPKKKREIKILVSGDTKLTSTKRRTESVKSDRSKEIKARDIGRKKEFERGIRPIQKDSDPSENLLYRATKVPFESNKRKH